MNQLFVHDLSRSHSGAPKRAVAVVPKVNLKNLERYCWRHLEPKDFDLVIVLHAVAYADRIFVRTRAKQWARPIEISVPVHDVARWDELTKELASTLGFLTGDDWHFVFRSRGRIEASALHLDLQKPLRNPAVLPFSGGLDSFALARMLEDNSPRDLIMVSAQHASLSSWRSLGTSDSAQLVVPFSLAAGSHAEPTFRTRTFVFFSLTALAAHLARIESVQVGEPGPGALGPELVPFADEHPYRGSSPLFTARLGSLLSRLWEGPMRFEHPHLWLTKAEVLRTLSAQQRSSGWERTRSCSRNPQRQGSGVKDQCGICSNCLSRRMSSWAADLESEEDNLTYLWGLDGSIPSRQRGAPAEAELSRADRDASSFAVVGLSELARTSSQECDSLSSALATNGLGNRAELRTRLGRLVRQHKDEWTAFVRSLPSHSWVRTIDHAVRGIHD